MQFIVNPRSHAAQRALGSVRAFAAKRGAGVVVTERPKHATALATHAVSDGVELVVAVGGDGTVNEVASALVGSKAVLGFVPCGSGNGLGRHLGVHGSVAKSLGILETGRPRLVDSGLVEGHPFFNVAGLGFEAEIAARFNRLTKRGFLRYLSAGTAQWSNSSPQVCLVSHDGTSRSVTAFTLAVANGTQYGNNALIAPAARIDDGLLDLVVLPSGSLARIPWALWRLFTGTLDTSATATSLRSSRFVVERPSAGVIHADGETFDAGRRVEFSVVPASLRVMVPSGAT